MFEEKFHQSVLKWCTNVVNQWKKRSGKKFRLHERLVVVSGNVITGWIPYYNDRSKAKEWKSFDRQIDIIIGLREVVDEEKVLIPLIAIEVKTGKNLNTDELDKKSAIYGSLRETYPWTYTVFINQSNEERGMQDVSWLRNGRQFNAIYTDWDLETRTLLKCAINERLRYQLIYWRL